MFMADRKIMSVYEQNHFLTKEACIQHFKDNKSEIDKTVNEILQDAFEKYEILHFGCLPVKDKYATQKHNTSHSASNPTKK